MSRGLGDVYKRQAEPDLSLTPTSFHYSKHIPPIGFCSLPAHRIETYDSVCQRLILSWIFDYSTPFSHIPVLDFHCFCGIIKMRKKKKHIEKSFCICYNANRKKEITSPCGQKVNPQTVLQHSLGILLFFYGGKVPTRLVAALIVTV